MAVKSQAMYFPLAHGTSVAPSGLLPSVLIRPDGSFVQGVSAFVRALHTKSLMAKCLADLPADCLQTSPWWLGCCECLCKKIKIGIVSSNRKIKLPFDMGF